MQIYFGELKLAKVVLEMGKWENAVNELERLKDLLVGAAHTQSQVEWLTERFTEVVDLLEIGPGQIIED